MNAYLPLYFYSKIPVARRRKEGVSSVLTACNLRLNSPQPRRRCRQTEGISKGETKKPFYAKSISFLCAKKRICAFSGAPRQTIINRLFCRQVFCQMSNSGKTLALARGSPLKSSSKFVTARKKTRQNLVLFLGAEKRI